MSYLISPTADETQATSCRRILVVDDDEGNATLMMRLLQSSGHDVKTAGNGPMALDLASEHQPEVVFLDIGLPGMDGYEVAQQLRATAGNRSLLLVAVSGYDSDTHESAPVEVFDHWLVKPVPFTNLQQLVDTAKF